MYYNISHAIRIILNYKYHKNVKKLKPKTFFHLVSFVLQNILYPFKNILHFLTKNTIHANKLRIFQ